MSSSAISNDSVAKLPTLFCGLPKSCKAMLVVLPILLVLRQLTPMLRAFRMSDDALKLECLPLLKKKISDSQVIRDFKTKFLVNKKATLPLNDGIVDKIFNLRGSLQCQGTSDNMNVTYTYGSKTFQMSALVAGGVRKLLFPTQDEVIKTFKNAVEAMSLQQRKVNSRFTADFDYVSLSETEKQQLQLPRGGDGWVCTVQTADGRIWRLNTMNEASYLSQCHGNTSFQNPEVCEHFDSKENIPLTEDEVTQIVQAIGKQMKEPS